MGRVTSGGIRRWEILSLDLYHVFVEGDTMRNKVDGIVDCKLILGSCWKFLLFLDNQLVRRLENFMIVFNW